MEPVNAAISYYGATGTVHALSSPAAPFAVCIWTSHIWRGPPAPGCSRQARAFGTGIEGAVDRYIAMSRATQQLVILTSC